MKKLIQTNIQTFLASEAIIAEQSHFDAIADSHDDLFHITNELRKFNVIEQHEEIVMIDASDMLNLNKSNRNLDLTLMDVHPDIAKLFNDLNTNFVPLCSIACISDDQGNISPIDPKLSYAILSLTLTFADTIDEYVENNLCDDTETNVNFIVDKMNEQNLTAN